MNDPRKNPRRPRGEGSISWRQDLQLWQGSFSLGRKPNGKRLRPTVYAKTKEELLVKMSDLSGRLCHDELGRTGQERRFASYAERWLLTLRPSLAGSSFERYVADTDILIRYLGDRQVRSISESAVQALYRQMAHDGHSAAQISACGTLLSRMLRTAHRQGLVSMNPVPLVPKPRVRRREAKPLDVSEVHRFLAAAGGHHLYALFVLAIDSGMRIGELLALEWEDVDFERGSVRVHRSLRRTRGGREVAEPKTKAGRRSIVLSPTTLKALEQHRRQAMRRQLINAPVFCNPSAGYLDYCYVIRRCFKPLLRKAGLPDMHFHDLRHTCATLLLLKGEKAHVVSQRLGHSKPSFTMDVYQHLLDGMQQGAADKMSDILGDPKQPPGQQASGLSEGAAGAS